MMWARTSRGQTFLAKLHPKLKSYRKSADASFRGRDVYKEMRDIVLEVLREELPNFSFDDAEVEVIPIMADDGKESYDIRFPVGINHAFQMSA